MTDMETFIIRVIDYDDGFYDLDEQIGYAKQYTCEISVDPTLLPDDEWRDTFYEIYTLEEVADHIVWNRVVMGFSSVEGYADKQEGVNWVIHNVKEDWAEVEDES